MGFISKENISIPERKKSAKKGDSGRVLVIGGSKEYVGAVALAGLAALRSGCDWVTIAAPEKVAWAINSLSADLVTIKLKGGYINNSHYKILKKLIEKHDVILIGNGIGTRKETKASIKKIIKNEKLKVIDADAIKVLSLGEISNAIITPHRKEFEAFLKNSKFNEKETGKIIKGEKNSMKKIQKILKNNIIIKKGRIDEIISKDKILYNKTGNAGMAKAGTGDVLAGLAAGFLAQNHDLEQSAINAAYFNGLAGDILMKRKKGYTYLASDIVEEITRLSH